MNIYLLKRTYGRPSWNEYLGFVVVASNEARARELASREDDDLPSERTDSGFSDVEIWTAPARSSCALIGSAAPGVEEGVVLDSNVGA